MYRIKLALLLSMLFLFGCSKWGDYVFVSEHFNYKVVFPVKWVVSDRSNDVGDYVVGSLDELPGARLIVKSRSIAPDVSPNEIYPGFILGGGDQNIFNEFRVTERGTASAKNADGRMIKVEYLNEHGTMSGIRGIFIGNRYILEVVAETPKDNFQDWEYEFRKMFLEIEL